MPSRVLAQLDIGADRYELVDARWPEPELEAEPSRDDEDGDQNDQTEQQDDDARSTPGHELVLRPLLAAGRPALRRLLFEEGDLRPATDAVLEQRVTRLLAIGRLRIVRHEPPTPELDQIQVADLSELAEPLSDLVPDGLSPTAEPDPEPTHVAFRLLDSAGTPVAGRAFSLTLPDGRTVDGVTGSDGRFSVDPVDTPGNCRLTVEAQAS